MPDIPSQNPNPSPSPLSSGEAFKLPVNGGNGNGEKQSAVSFLSKLMAGQKGSSAGPVPLALPSFSVSGALAAKPFTRLKLEEFSEQKKLKLAKITFWAVTLLMVLGVGYFMIQLNPDLTILGDTVAKEYQKSREKLIAKQTELSENRLRLAQRNNDRVNLLADAFLVNLGQADSKILSPGERQRAGEKLAASRQLIKESLMNVKSALQKPFSFPLPDLGSKEENAPDPFHHALLQSLQEKESALKSQKQGNPLEVRLVSNMALLFQNKPFQNYMRLLNTDALDDAKIEEAIGKIRDLGKDDTALMAKVKSDRIRWTQIIDDINTITKEIDPLYGKDNLFEELGGIRYSSYSFDQTNRRLTLAGEVKTPIADSKTFSIIAKLIEKFEASPKFKNVEMRDFSKSLSEKEGFSASLKFDLLLE